MRCPVWLRLFFAPIAPRFPVWLHRALVRFDPDVIHIHMPNVSPFWLLVMPSARRRTWVVHWHSDVEPSRFKLSLRLLYPHYRIFERALLEGADCILVTSRQYLDASKPLQPWLHKCHVVPLGVDPSRLPAVSAARNGRPLEDRRTARASRWDGFPYYKGFETLVHAVLGDATKELVIVGEGEERPADRAPARQGRHPHHVRLVGEVDDDTVRRHMASCDVLACPRASAPRRSASCCSRRCATERRCSRATFPEAASPGSRATGRTPCWCRPKTCSRGAARWNSCTATRRSAN
jgi:glycosyltransferase involved in cell wall biosynthesis